MSKIKAWLQVALAVVTILGLITFSLFILEEAFQTTMFGTWPAQDAKDWHTVLIGTDLMQGFVTTMKIVNYTCGWLQPLAFIAYRAYAKSAEYYILALRTKVFAFAPETFNNRVHTFTFTPKKIIDGHILVNGRIKVVTDMDIKDLNTFRIRAKITVQDNFIIITPENIEFISVLF